MQKKLPFQKASNFITALTIVMLVLAALPVSPAQAVTLLDQTITVTTSAPSSAANGTSFDVAASSSSGLLVAITTTGVCSGSGDGTATISMTSGTGTCTVHYNQAGDSNYNAAPEVTEDTTAQKADQATLSIGPHLQ